MEENKIRIGNLLEVRVESEENVFPMVPAGAPVSAIRLE